MFLKLLLCQLVVSYFFSFFFYLSIVDLQCYVMLLQIGATAKEHACQSRRQKRHGFDPWVGKIIWRRVWQPTPVFLPGESHGQRTLMGNSPWSHKELDMTKVS